MIENRWRRLPARILGRRGEGEGEGEGEGDGEKERGRGRGRGTETEATAAEKTVVAGGGGGRPDVESGGATAPLSRASRARSSPAAPHKSFMKTSGHLTSHFRRHYRKKVVESESGGLSCRHLIS